MNRLAPPALVFALALAACNTGFEPQYRVTDLRILAVRSQVVSSAGCPTATTPSPAPCADATPDDTITLDALVANPRGRTDLLVRWFACAPSATDVPPPCIDDAVLSDPESIATMPGVIALTTSGTGESVTIPLSTIPPAALQAGLDFIVSKATEQRTFQCRAFAEVPVVLIATAGGQRDVAVKRVRLVPSNTPFAYKPNANPQLLGLSYGANADQCSTSGTSIAGVPLPAGRITLCGVHEPLIGTYDVCDADGNPSPTFETYGWQWYVTAGDFPGSGGVGNETDDAPDFERPPGELTLWGILRDGRGGVDWQRWKCPAVDAPSGCQQF